MMNMSYLSTWQRHSKKEMSRAWNLPGLFPPSLTFTNPYPGESKYFRFAQNFFCTLTTGYDDPKTSNDLSTVIQVWRHAIVVATAAFGSLPLCFFKHTAPSKIPSLLLHSGWDSKGCQDKRERSHRNQALLGDPLSLSYRLAHCQG